MKTFYADEQKRHDPKAFLSSGVQQPNPEQPERVERLLAGARAAGLTIHRPPVFGLGPIAAIHTPEYLEFLAAHLRALAAHRRRVGRSDPQHPSDRPRRRLSGVAPPARPATTWPTPPARSRPRPSTAPAGAPGAAVAAADAVLAGEPAAYALCRPPGHHAFADVAGGFCFLNNSAIAAQRLRAAPHASRSSTSTCIMATARKASSTRAPTC